MCLKYWQQRKRDFNFLSLVILVEIAFRVDFPQQLLPRESYFHNGLPHSSKSGGENRFNLSCKYKKLFNQYKKDGLTPNHIFQKKSKLEFAFLDSLVKYEEFT